MLMLVLPEANKALKYRAIKILRTNLDEAIAFGLFVETAGLGSATDPYKQTDLKHTDIITMLRALMADNG